MVVQLEVLSRPPLPRTRTLERKKKTQKRAQQSELRSNIDALCITTNVI